MAKGWLDNYGEQENYNDSKTSVPKGYVGQGYDTSGRNYSPAWGGQFQMGGYVYPVNYVPQAQAGDVISNLQQEGIDGLQSIYRNYPPSTLLGRLPFNLGAGIGLLQSHVNKQSERLSDQLGVFPNPYTQAASLIALEAETEKQNMHEFAKNKNRGKDLKKITPKKELNIKFSDDENFQMGGSIPGAVGFSYARTQGAAPSNGPYAKKTKASAQNGQEMEYYKQGLDWKPKSISKQGSIIKDDMGQWAHPGEITEINSNDITMEGVPYDVLGISDTGDTKLMQPGKNYKFKGKKVTEYPMAQNGLRQEQKGLQNLDNLTNFTNYNTKQPGGWLNKYN